MGNINTTFFDNLDAAATWSAGVAFKRSKGLPLDKYSVFETKALAIEYAEKRGAYSETPVSYPGQVIAVAEGNKMVAYVLAENAEGTKLELQQIGIIPTGDGKTIDVTEDGVISLLAADAQVDEKNEAGEATGNKVVNAGAQLVLQSDGTIKWVQPDTSTAEGQAAAISALQDRMTTAESDIDKLEAKVGAAAEGETEATGLFKAIADEEARALAAEKALDDAIKAIDFIDGNELADAIKDFAKTSEVNNALALKADITYVDGEIDKIEEAIGNLNHFKAEVVTDKSKMTEIGVLYLYKIDSATGPDVYEEYIVINGEATLIGDTTTDLGNYYNKTEVDNKFTAEKEAREALADEVDALKAVDNATQAELDAYKEVVTADIAKAKGEAIADTDTKLANYYTKSDVYTKDEITGLNHATKTEVENAVKAEAEIARAAEKANADAIAAIKDSETIDSFADVVNALANKQDKLTEGAYATESFVEGKVKALADGAVAEAKAQADKGVADAKAAKEAADEAQADANTNALNIQEIEKEINGYTIGEGEEVQVVDGLITKVSNNTTRIGTLEGTVNEHTTAIGNNATAAANAQAQADEALRVANLKTTMGEVEAKGYAVAETVNAEIAKKTTMAEVEAKGYAVAETVNGDLAKKADKETTYTKTEVEGLIAPLATTESLNKVKATAEQGVSDAAAAKSVADAAKARIDGFIDGTAEAESAIDTLIEIQQYMNADTLAFTQLSNKVTNIENGTTTVPKATDADTVDGKHASDFEVAGAAEDALAEAKEYADAINTGVMSVESLTDLLVITTDENGSVKIALPTEIIFNGGGANV